MSDDARDKREAPLQKATEASPVPSPAKPSQDVVLLGPKTADGNGIHVLRARNERIEAGELRALREGQPVTGEIVALEPRKETPQICDVRESFQATPTAPRSTEAPHKGPARVATNAYRDGWEEIFGASKHTDTKPSRDLN